MPAATTLPRGRISPSAKLSSKAFPFSAMGDRSFGFAQDDSMRVAESAGMLGATAGYAPTVHFYPALSGDPSPRVYSRKACVTNCFNPRHKILILTALLLQGATP